MTTEKDEKVDEKADDLQAEYDKAWDGDDSDKDGDAGNPTEDNPSSEKEGGADVGPEKKPVAPENPAPRSKEFGPIESMEKAVKDSQRYAAGLKQEVDRLHAQIKAQEEGTASQEDVDKARKAVLDAREGYDDVKKRVYDDYPELQELIEPILSANQELKAEVAAVKTGRVEDRQRAEADASRQRFEEIVKPAVLKTHPDFERLLFTTNEAGIKGIDPAYSNWAEAQAPGLRTAALFSDDPNDISYAVGQYKKHIAMAGGVTDSLKAKQESKKAAILRDTKTMRGGYMPSSLDKGEDKNDYDAGWKDADKQLKAQGIT